MATSKRLVEIAVKASTKDAESGLGKIASGLGNIKLEHAGMVGAVVAGTVAVVAALKETAESAFNLAAEMAKVGDSFDKMSQRTSLSVETLSEWSYITQRAGGDIGQLERGIQATVRSMRDYQEGSATAIRAWDDLGVSVVNADGSLRDINAVLYEARDAISKMDNETEAGAISMEVFGRAGRQLLPVLRLNNEEFEAQTRRVKALGGVYDSDITDASARFIDAQLDIKTALDGVKMRLATVYTEDTARAMEAIASAIADVGSMAIESADDIADFTDGLADMIEKVAEYAKVLASLVPVMHNVNQIGAMAFTGQIRGAWNQLDDLLVAVQSLQWTMADVATGGRMRPEGSRSRSGGTVSRPAASVGRSPNIGRDFSPVAWDSGAPVGRGEEYAGSPLALAGLLMDLPGMYAEAIEGISDAEVEHWERMKAAGEEFAQAMDDNLARLTDQLGYIAAEGVTTMLGLRDGAFMMGRAIKQVAIQALEEMIQKMITIKLLKGVFGLPFAAGGAVPGYAGGGMIRAAAGVVIPPIGQAGMDSVPIMAMPGEGVIKRDTMQQLDSFLAANSNTASTNPAATVAGGGEMHFHYNISRPIAYRDHVALGRDSADALRDELRGMI